MNKRSVLRITIVVGILVIAIWLIGRSIDVAELWHIVTSSNAMFLFLSMPAIVISHVVRAHRWNRLLASEPIPPKLTTSFSAVMIGYAANTLVPRSGELLRPFVLSQRSNVPFATALSSVVVERVMDVMTLLAAIMVILVFHQGPVLAALPDLDPTTLLISFAVPTALLIALLTMITFTDVAPQILYKILSRFSVKVADKVNGVFADIKRGASSLKRPQEWPTILVDTILIWALWVASLWLVLIAMPWAGSSFTPLDGAVLLVVIAIGVTIAPTPGALGVYQGFAQIALIRMYGATAAEGLAFGILAWTINYGIALVLGGIAFIIESRHGIQWKQASS